MIRPVVYSCLPLFVYPQKEKDSVLDSCPPCQIELYCALGGLYIAAGWDPFVLVEQGVSAAGRISGGSKPRRDKKLPESLDVFGWCTWDAFYSTVSAKGVAEGLKSLCDGGTPPRLLIIDDGWQVL